MPAAIRPSGATETESTVARSAELATVAEHDRRARGDRDEPSAGPERGVGGAPRQRERAQHARPVAASRIVAVAPGPATTSREPSGLRRAARSGAEALTIGASSGSMRGSQTRAVPSSLAVTTAAPSGRNDAPVTDSVSPASTARPAPVPGFQTRAVRSSLVVTSEYPSGLNAALVT